VVQCGWMLGDLWQGGNRQLKRQSETELKHLDLVLSSVSHCGPGCLNMNASESLKTLYNGKVMRGIL